MLMVAIFVDRRNLLLRNMITEFFIVISENGRIRLRCPILKSLSLTGKRHAENSTWRNDCKCCRHWIIDHHLCQTFFFVLFFRRFPSTRPLESDRELYISHRLLHWRTFSSRPRLDVHTLSFSKANDLLWQHNRRSSLRRNRWRSDRPSERGYCPRRTHECT